MDIIKKQGMCLAVIIAKHIPCFFIRLFYPIQMDTIQFISSATTPVCIP